MNKLIKLDENAGLLPGRGTNDGHYILPLAVLGVPWRGKVYDELCFKRVLAQTPTSRTLHGSWMPKAMGTDRLQWNWHLLDLESVVFDVISLTVVNDKYTLDGVTPVPTVEAEIVYGPWYAESNSHEMVDETTPVVLSPIGIAHPVGVQLVSGSQETPVVQEPEDCKLANLLYIGVNRSSAAVKQVEYWAWSQLPEPRPSFYLWRDSADFWSGFMVEKFGIYLIHKFTGSDEWVDVFIHSRFNDQHEQVSVRPPYVSTKSIWSEIKHYIVKHFYKPIDVPVIQIPDAEE